jgi:hypothetical protein
LAPFGPIGGPIGPIGGPIGPIGLVGASCRAAPTARWSYGRARGLRHRGRWPRVEHIVPLGVGEPVVAGGRVRRRARRGALVARRERDRKQRGPIERAVRPHFCSFFFFFVFFFFSFLLFFFFYFVYFFFFFSFFLGSLFFGSLFFPFFG